MTTIEAFTARKENFSTNQTISGKMYICEEILLGLVILLNFYLTIMTIGYAVKHGKTTLKRTNILCCILTVLLLLRSAALELRVRTGAISDFYCNLSIGLLNIFYGTNKSLPYVILWIRQRTMYASLLQKKKNKLMIKFTSRCTLVGIVIFHVILTTVLLVYLDKRSTPFGCTFRNPEEFQAIFNILSPAMFAASTLFQIILLGLVLYPLALHMVSKNISHGKLKKTIIRVAVSTSVCILSDVVFLILKYVQPPNTASYFVLLSSCYNHTISLIAVLFSFADPALRFFSLVKTISIDES